MGTRKIPADAQAYDYHKRGYITFSDIVRNLMEEQKFTQRHLASITGLPTGTINNICNDSNGKGGSYTPTIRTVNALAVAFGLTTEDYNTFLLLAFPQIAIAKQILDSRGDNIDFDYALEALKFETYFPID